VNLGLRVRANTQRHNVVSMGSNVHEFSALQLHSDPFDSCESICMTPGQRCNGLVHGGRKRHKDEYLSAFLESFKFELHFYAEGWDVT
jgi:hypothetical protein